VFGDRNINSNKDVSAYQCDICDYKSNVGNVNSIKKQNTISNSNNLSITRLSNKYGKFSDLYNLAHLELDIIKKENKFSEYEYKNIIFYPTSTKEWFNSVYSYNKSYIKPLISLDILINKLFGSYFNMVNYKIKNTFKRRRAKRYNYSSNKVHLSRAEVKHTNTGIVILLYMHNRSKFRYEQFIRKFVNFFNVREIKSYNNDGKNLIIKKNRLWYILKKRFSTLNIFNVVMFNINNTLKKNFSSKLKSKLLINNKLLNKFSTLNKFSILNYIKIYNFIFRKRLSKLEKVFFKNAKLINFNKSKFNNILLNLRDLGLIKILTNIYNKNIKIQIIDLKSIHLNSDVFSSTITIKLRNRKNKAVIVLRKAIINMIKIPTLHTLIVNDDFMEVINKNNILNLIKHQITSGIRFEASGRLTRRLTALRAIFKRRYAGSLKDIRSSYIKKSSTMLRGYIKSNLQYTLVHSKTRNGSFGLKSWLSSH